MRGLRLFVRPSEPSDAAVVRAFLERHAPAALEGGVPRGDFGLVGKLLGDIVAWVALADAGPALRIDAIVVATELRRKWIGRRMIEESVILAARLDKSRLEVTDPRDARRFFERTGFREEGDRWILDVEGGKA